jgi:vanillate O-demethylase ferredoxin subunit
MSEQTLFSAAPSATSSTWIDVQVRRRWLEASDTVALELAPVEGHRLPTFQAGACIDVAFPGGAVRPYSLANAPHVRSHYLLAVRLAPQGQGGSRAMHALREGDRLRVSPPRNSFPLRGGALHSVLLAGGVGIAPLLSMTEHLWRAAASFELHYGFRTPEQAAFLQHLRQAPYAHRVFFWCSQADARQRMDAAHILSQVPKLSHVYLCGPAAFMGAAYATATDLGWSADRLHQECFDPVGCEV